MIDSTPVIKNLRDAGIEVDFSLDQGQRDAFDHLCQLRRQIIENLNRPRFLRSVFKKNVDKIRGLYMWGGVGRGKTYMMDLFFESIPTPKKQRIHFHRFMQFVHSELKNKRNLQDPLPVIAKDFSKRVRLLCLDEFFVLDIADAVILANLIKALLANNVVLVMTSNTKPDNLYLGGIQRDRFTPAIRLINSQMKVVNIADGVDYRLKALKDRTLFFERLDENVAKLMQAEFTRVCDEPKANAKPLDILGRKINVIQRSHQVVWFDFVEICDGPRSKADYIEIANIYRTVMISNIPILNWKYENQARRFIEMIDEFYDHGVHLIASAATEIDSLYTGARLAQEYQRTASRLHEMQTEQYLSCEHCG